jgi:hypothetical protein
VAATSAAALTQHAQSVPSQQNIFWNIPEFVSAISEPSELRFSQVSSRFRLSRRSGSNRALCFLRFDPEVAVHLVFCAKNAFSGGFLGTCWPISTSGDLFLTKSAVPDATVMFFLRDSDPFVVQCSFGALKRPFLAFSGLGDLFGMLL